MDAVPPEHSFKYGLADYFPMIANGSQEQSDSTSSVGRPVDPGIRS